LDFKNPNQKKTPSTSYFVLGFGWFPRKKASEVPWKIKNHEASFSLVNLGGKENQKSLVVEW